MRAKIAARRRLLICVLAVAVAAAAATGAWAAGVGDTPVVPSRFLVQFNGVSVQATSYSIDGISLPSRTGTPSQSYRVVIHAPVTNDPALVQAFKSGQIADVRIELFDITGVPVAGYDFAQAKVASYEQTGSQATGGSFDQQLVFTSNSLTVS